MIMANLISLCKRRGFIFPSGEIYGGLNGFWDFGPLGVELKRNFKDAWWQDMVAGHNELQNDKQSPDLYAMVGLDSSIITHPQTWRVSGHTDLFSDQLVDCRETKKRYRYDHLYGASLVLGAEKIFVVGSPDAEVTYDDLYKRAVKLLGIRKDQVRSSEWGPIVPLADFSHGCFHNVLGPDASKPGTLTDPREFNLMFETKLGPVSDAENRAYLRPETAQGIFLNFKNIISTIRIKIPFGVAQIGKSFRNEITPKNFIYRSREFEQAEIEFFCHPSSSTDWYMYWRQQRVQWYLNLGLAPQRLRVREHANDELSHYSKGTADIEYAFPFLPAGHFGELEGVAHRGDFDLRSHSEGKRDAKATTTVSELTSDAAILHRGSGKDLTYRDDTYKEKFYPHVIEPSAGVERGVLAFLCDAYHEDSAPDENGTLEPRIVLRLHPRLAPFKAAVMPLIKKGQMAEIAREIYGTLKNKYVVTYDEKDSIGRRYRRQDEIGTPICITVDSQTVEDKSVTVRDRDSLKQVRIPLHDCAAFIERLLYPARTTLDTL